jgi:hypothetical protein
LQHSAPLTAVSDTSGDPGQLEIAQAAQDLNNNSVRLVTGKHAFLRFHARSLFGTTLPATAQLTLYHGEKLTVRMPINGQSSKVFIPSKLARSAVEHSFLFELPCAYRTGTVQLQAEVKQMSVAIQLEPCRVRVEYVVGHFKLSAAGRLLKGLMSWFGEYERGKIR